MVSVSKLLLVTVGLLISCLQAHKILVLGDYDHRREFFFQVAQKITQNPLTDNEVYFASLELKSIHKEIVTKRLVKYGFGQHDIKHDMDKTEYQNYYDQDLQALKVYFGDKDLLESLKNEKFDIGIGGLGKADSILFRYLDIPYIKLSEEDIESYSMQMKLGMPVVGSHFHSTQIECQIRLKQDTNFAGIDYRFFLFNRYYLNFWTIYKHKSAMREILPKKLHKLIDDYDQDHAMFLGQGATLDLLQSVQIKPGNVKNVYPMVPENKRPVYKLDEKKFANAEMVVILNIESAHEHDIFYKNPIKLSKFIDDNKPGSHLINKARNVDTNLVVVVQDESMLKYLPEKENVQFIVNTDPQHVTIERLFPEQRLVWSSTCSQENLISSYAVHGASMIGFYSDPHPETSTTQRYNCMKLHNSKAGFVMTNLDDLEGYNSALYNLKDPKQREWRFTKKFTEVLQSQRESKKDLEFWIDYVVEFGISHKIPNYDKMSLVTYYNLDIFLITIVLALILATIAYKIAKSLYEFGLNKYHKYKQD